MELNSDQMIEYVEHEETVIEQNVPDVIGPLMVPDPASEDEDYYEEIDDEDDEYDDDDEELENLRYETHMEQPGTSSSFHDNRPCCYVCQKKQNLKIRLFKWPRNSKIRERWAEFFDIDDRAITENFDHAFICSFHFAAHHFLYSNDKIFWAKDAFPRYKRKRPANAEPFPWELEQNAIIKSRNPPPPPVIYKNKNPAPNDVVIHFRESNFKIANRKKHRVAMIPLPGNPHVYYEFSYNRTSHIDDTKFYSCLGCRKAKSDTKVKDVIRTIHLKGSTLLSKGDPLYGHHFGCRPVNNTRISRNEELGEGYSTVFASKKEQLVYMEDEWAVDEQGMPVQVRKYLPADDLFYTGPLVAQSMTTMSHMEEPPQMTLEAHPLDVAPLQPQRDKSLISMTRKIKKRALGMRRRNVPKCHICLHSLPSTHALAQHLLAHLKCAPTCRQCGNSCSPDDPPHLLRRHLCTQCHRIRRNLARSNHSLQQPPLHEMNVRDVDDIEIF